MERERVLTILREHEAELKAAGLLHLRLFGSVARGDAMAGSDVDLLAEYDESRRITLLTLAGFENQLADLLGTAVHLSSSRAMYPEFREHAFAEALLAF